MRGARNFSDSFVAGICNTALKKDNVKKHHKSDQHVKAVDIERKPTITEMYHFTPIGRALARSSQEQTTRVCKLFEVAYMLAKEEIPFAKYPAVLDLEKRHGVSLGTAYATEHKCRYFTVLIGEAMRDTVLDSLRKSRYLAVLIDGSTDSSVVEKEMIYVMFVGPNGKVECRFFQLKDVSDATAPGLKSLLLESLASFGIDLAQKLVSICVDGAAVNLGVHNGLSTLLKQEAPWLVAIHCMNHRLELAVKDAFSGSYFDEVTSVLVGLHSVYQHSPKRLHQLRDLAEIMEERIRKPDRAKGTRWVQHKSRALKSLLLVIVTHLQAMASEESSVKPAHKAKFKGYVKTLTSYKFVLHMLLFDALLDPLAALSCSLQGSSADLPLAIAKLRAFKSIVSKLKDTEVTKETELSRVVAATTCGSEAVFRTIKLQGVTVPVQQAFMKSRPALVDKIVACVQNRFDEMP